MDDFWAGTYTSGILESSETTAMVAPNGDLEDN
jgi:hypothetical protein